MKKNQYDLNPETEEAPIRELSERTKAEMRAGAEQLKYGELLVNMREQEHEWHRAFQNGGSNTKVNCIYYERIPDGVVIVKTVVTFYTQITKRNVKTEELIFEEPASIFPSADLKAKMMLLHG